MVWKVVDGELECSRLKPRSAIIATGEVSWTDYAFEADVKLLVDHGLGDFDLAVRMTSNNDGYAFLVGDWVGEPSVYVQLVPDLGMKIIEPFDALEMDTWHHVKVKTEGDKFTFWVNNRKVIEYQDGMYQTGMVGFGVSNYTLRFDNVVITGEGVPNVRPPTWQDRPVEPGGKLTSTWAQIKNP